MASKARGGRVGWFKRFLHWLTTSARSSHRKAHPDLNPIDVDKLARELNLHAEAKRLGAVGVPAPEATSPCGPEATVIQRVERARQEYVDWAATRLNVLSRDLSRSNVTAEVNRARQADAEFERKASAVLSEAESVLRRLADTARARKDELAAFKAENKLTREANYLTSSGRFLAIGFLLLLILVEGAFNANFFATGLDTGLLGGLIEAALAALGNVSIAFLLGRFAVPYVFHAKLLPKVVGFMGLALALATIAGVGLVISHYRDALTSELPNAASAVQATLLSDPFGLKPGGSWILFGVSISFGVLALFDGLLFDDRYPGYGSITRRTLEAVDDYEDEVAGLREKLEELKEEELQTLDRVLESSQASIAAFESAIRDKSTAGHRLQQAVTDADNSLEALLKLFRTENEVHRGGLARPAYYDTYPPLRALTLPSFDTTEDDAALSEQRTLVKALLDEAQTIRGQIQAAFNKQFDRVNPLDAHFPTQGAA